MAGLLSFRCRTPWNWLQVGLWLLVLSPLLGGVAIAIASAIAWRQSSGALLKRPLNWGLAGLGLGLTVTVGFAVNLGNAALGLFNFLPYFGVFAALSGVLQTITQLRRMAWILALTSIPALLLGYGQQFWGWAGPVQWGVFNWSLAAMGNPPGRMTSVFDYTNVFASYLVVIVTLTLGLWIETYRNPQLPQDTIQIALSSNRWFSAHQQRRLQLGLLSLLVLGNGMALILTHSRNAWAIALAGSVAYALDLGWYWLLGILGSGVGVILGAAFAPSPLGNGLRTIVPAYLWARLNDQLYPNRPLADLRTTQWHFAGELIIQRPWTGWGLRSFTPLYQDHWHLWLGHPHNLWLMLASETGVITTGLLTAIVGWVVVRAVRQWSTQKLNPGDRTIVFSYLIAFLALAGFHLLDVPLFDLRINCIGWLLLAGLWGWVDHTRIHQPAAEG